MKELDLHILKDGISTGLSTINGAFLAEAASVCLENFKHPSEVQFPVTGSFSENYNLIRIKIDELSKNSFADLEEAAQYGAMGIAVAIINTQKGWHVIRSWKGTGFDYWVGESKDGLPFQEKMRLEVSGDLKGTESEIKTRLKKKLEQTMQSDCLGLPACAIIVEFSNPKSHTGQR